MTRNKKIGLLWLLGPITLLILTLLAFTISTFVANTFATNSQILGGTQTTMKTFSTILGLLGLVAVIGIIIGIPVGIVFLSKKEISIQTVSDLQKLPAYANLTPEQIGYINNWSWGAFLGGTIWPLGNKLWLWGLISIIPVINLYSWMNLSMHGRKLSWEKGNWQNFDHFKKHQKRVAWVIGLVLPLIIMLQIITEIYK